MNYRIETKESFRIIGVSRPLRKKSKTTLWSSRACGKMPSQTEPSKTGGVDGYASHGAFGRKCL